MQSDDLIYGGVYNFKNQPEKLKYIGKNWSGNGYWHQFELIGKQGVWCELLDFDLQMIEETKPERHCQNGNATVCLAASSDGVICPEFSCDIDDGIR